LAVYGLRLFKPQSRKAPQWNTLRCLFQRISRGRPQWNTLRCYYRKFHGAKQRKDFMSGGL